MNKGRLEAFSDGVLAIIITIMVLELKVPHEPRIEALAPLVPVFLSYVLSFVYVGIYWNNHHHLFQIVKHVRGPVLWANLHLLFWLSLVPFVTAWSGENHFEPLPVALYGFVLLMAGVAFFVLVQALKRTHGEGSDIHRAVRGDFKGKISPVLYAIAIVSAFWTTAAALAIYAFVAGLWLIPDSRVEKLLEGKR